MCISHFFFNLRSINGTSATTSYTAFSTLSTAVVGNIGAPLLVFPEASAHSSEATVTSKLDRAHAPPEDAGFEMTKLPARWLEEGDTPTA